MDSTTTLHEARYFSRFYPAHGMRDVPVTLVATLEDATAIGRAAGLRYVNTGNVPFVKPLADRRLGEGYMRITTALPADKNRFVATLAELLSVADDRTAAQPSARH
jgi:hypothetical protein